MRFYNRPYFQRWTALALVVGATVLSGCKAKFKDPNREFGPSLPVNATKPFVSEVHLPENCGAYDSRLNDIHDKPVGISCNTCHGSATTGGLIVNSDAKDFHKDLKIHHGSLNCNSCHDEDRTKLHLADGSKVEFFNAMQLCAQCHGVQFRDYQKGAHGGMNGYWDLQRGPRVRNHCLDCHAAHSPAYQAVRPVHPPKDRFIDWNSHQENSHER